MSTFPNPPRTAARFVAASLTLAAIVGVGANAQTPRFVAHEIATGLRGGYQTVAADLNKDGRLDLIAVASGIPELVWFENPSWTRHVLASGFAGLINVAAADLDRDGIPEIAVAHGFSTRPEQSAGIVSLLTHRADPRQPWSVREIDRVATSHRLRWFATSRGELFLVNSPLAGAMSRQPDYAGPTPIYFYRAPDWKRETLTDAEQGVVHAVEPLLWDEETGLALLSAGFLGVHQYRFVNGRWMRARVVAGDPAPAPRGGASEIAIGRLGPSRYLATVEPWHGNQVVIYRPSGREWLRDVIDTTVVDGHTLVVADLDGDRRDEVIVGQRGGSRSLWVYTPDETGTVWSRGTIDSGGMAGAGCVAADLNDDGLIDVACIGSATANLKWYQNMGFRGGNPERDALAVAVAQALARHTDSRLGRGAVPASGGVRHFAVPRGSAWDTTVVAALRTLRPSLLQSRPESVSSLGVEVRGFVMRGDTALVTVSDEFCDPTRGRLSLTAYANTWRFVRAAPTGWRLVGRQPRPPAHGTC